MFIRRGMDLIRKRRKMEHKKRNLCVKTEVINKDWTQWDRRMSGMKSGIG